MLEIAGGLGILWAASLLLFLFADYLSIPAFARCKIFSFFLSIFSLQSSWTDGSVFTLLLQSHQDLEVQGKKVRKPFNTWVLTLPL